MTGRPPLPTVLKTGHQKRNPDEPKPTPLTPKPPAQLKGRALNEWRRVVPELEALGLLTGVDRAELAFYCMTFARWQDAEDKVSQEGLLITTKSGNVIQHPALGVANTAMKLCHRFATEFGFTPSARSRIKAPAPGDGDDGLNVPE